MRRIDVLTLGLSAQSRWNPLYRRFARRRAEASLTTALKALMLRLALADGEALILDQDELDAAAACCAVIAPDGDGVRLTWRGDEVPRAYRILWGERADG